MFDVMSRFWCNFQD